MKKENTTPGSAMLKASLFGSLTDSEMREIDKQIDLVSVPAGTTLSRAGDIGFIVSGVAEVLRGGDRKIVINVLGPGDFFGMAGLFGPYGSSGAEIRAKKLCNIEFIPGNEVKRLVGTNPGFATAYVALISGKLRFLSRRVRDFSSESVTSRLAGYLLSSGGGRCSVVELGRRLGAGRTSLYRSLAALEESGAVSKDGKHISVNDREKLENICNS